MKKYPGQKSVDGVYHRIINEIPPHKHYVELFAGSAGIYRNIYPSVKSTLVELDKKQAGQLVKLFVSTRARIDKSNYRGSVPETVVINGCATRFLKKLDPVDTFVYADPPYVLSSRRSGAVIYNCEMSDADHIRFLNTAKAYTGCIAISNYRNDIYDTLLTGWRKIEFKAATRRGIAYEVVYFNYPGPSELHDYRYLGKNKTDRQRIHRKIKRWSSRLKQLPQLERAAILNNLKSL